MPDPIDWMSMLSGGGELLGGIAGEVFSGRGRQREAIERALAELRGTNVEAGPTAYGSNVDFLGALGALRRQYEQGGMSGADRLAQAQAMNDAATRARMQQGGLMQAMAQRGQLGGGAELAGRLASNQGTTEAMYGAGAQGAGAAQARALESLRGWGGMAGQQASAADTIARFNAAQRLAKAQTMLNAGYGAGGYYGQEANRRQDFGAGIGRAAGAGLGYLFGQRRQDEEEPIRAPELQ